MDQPLYRIIDANFNRAREAIRVIEDFCRFALNSEHLTGRAKQLRHTLSAAINKLDTARLIAGRDTLGDVGVNKMVEGQLGRTDLQTCLTAACKRLPEALRVLAETIQTVDAAAAQTMENLRYEGYTLEKDITLFSNAAEKFKRVALYVIISSNLPAEVMHLSHRCIAGGADCIQLRAKDTADDKLLATAAELVQICKAAGALSIINDRVDIAVAAGADGGEAGLGDAALQGGNIVGRQVVQLDLLAGGQVQRRIRRMLASDLAQPPPLLAGEHASEYLYALHPESFLKLRVQAEQARGTAVVG